MPYGKAINVFICLTLIITIIIPPGSAISMDMETPNAIAEENGRQTNAEREITKRLNPAVSLWGTPHTSDDVYLVKDRRAKLSLSLGDLETTLEGGYLGGTDADDAVLLVLDVPYLYVDAEGKTVQTTSKEEWKNGGMGTEPAIDDPVSGTGVRGGGIGLNGSFRRSA